MKDTLPTMKSLLGLVLSIAGFAAALARDPISLEKYDRSGNGILDPDEWEVYAIHVKSPIHRTYDLNLNGKLDPSEIALIEQDARVQLDDRVQDLRYTTEVRGPQKLAEAQRTLEPQAVKDPPKPLFGDWRIRGEFETIGVLNDPKKFADASGAQFGSSDNRTTGDRNLTVKGAVFRAIVPLNPRAPKTKSGLELVDWGFGVGVDFDVNRTAKNDVGVTEDSNLIRARATWELEWNGGKTGLTQMYGRVTPFFATDSGIDSKQIGTELEWQPSLPWLGGDGVPRRLFGLPLETKATWMLHAEAGRVLVAGGKKGLKSGDDFFRIGPKVAVRFFYADRHQAGPVAKTIWSRLHPSISFQQLDGQGTGAHSTNLLEAVLAWDLDAKGHTTLELKYSKGQKPLDGDDRIDLFELTTGVKF
jgi:hypothetical protein